MHKWIKAKEMLPGYLSPVDCYENVLVLYKQPYCEREIMNTTVAYYCDDDKEWYFSFKDDSTISREYISFEKYSLKVTHWMPIPELPDDNEDES